MPTSITRRELAAQPILFVRMQVSRAELSGALGSCLGSVFTYCQEAGIALAGKPFSRYPSAGPGLLTIEAGMPIATAAEGRGEIEFGHLQAGPALFAVHSGPYDQLGETYAAIERWMGENGAQPGGAPWESYVTDPADYPDPKDWRTEVYWPLSE
ncbi:MAG TPA: GyrI-like domain-containing protein [Gammaproteobacteria bacterium]|nr:GyrI-like domain-containing protein [Gammaproteobacteria bacterium]